MKMAAIKRDRDAMPDVSAQKAFASTMEPPSKAKRTSLYGVMPSSAPNGPSCPKSGVARAMFVPTVTAQNPN